MNMKDFYIAPQVRRILEFEPEQDLLTGSVVTPDTKIETAGQQVVTKDFSESGFNTVWE